jgi:hypothetical protein
MRMAISSSFHRSDLMDASHTVALESDPETANVTSALDAWRTPRQASARPRCSSFMGRKANEERSNHPKTRRHSGLPRPWD